MKQFQKPKFSLRISILRVLKMANEMGYTLNANKISEYANIENTPSFYVVLSDMVNQGIISYGGIDKHHEYSITEAGYQYLEDFRTRKLKELYEFGLVT
jgi:DNA-binding PadR family transcriptional regulator